MKTHGLKHGQRCPGAMAGQPNGRKLSHLQHFPTSNSFDVRDRYSGVEFAPKVLPYRLRLDNLASQTREEENKAMVLEAFDTLFNPATMRPLRDFWLPDYIQHSAHIEPGAMGCSIWSNDSHRLSSMNQAHEGCETRRQL